MAKFMFLQRGGDACAPERSPEAMQQAMQAWGEWMEGGRRAGWLLDPGDALTSEGRVVHADRTVTDGPFAESKEWVGGYTMVEAADLDAAVEIARSMPEVPGTVEVRRLAGHSME
ncbi:MAG: YciI family protein [Acidobacteriota bacterium]